MSVVERFLTALATRDFVAFERLLDESVWCRAMLVREIVEHHRADTTTAMFREWYGEALEVEVVDNAHHTMQAREFVRYRIRLRPVWAPDRWHVIEQAGYLTVVDERIRRLDLTCTGFYPVDEPSTELTPA